MRKLTFTLVLSLLCAAPWQENTVWLSTWNEYGDGTYMMPTAQRARLCNLYPQQIKD